MEDPRRDVGARYTFTVFTPTYNRAATLPRVYESLRVQTYRNFQWLIVDDGSADETPDLVRGWQSENAIPIKYIVQSHAGKPVALNRGAQEADGDLFLELDSDDSCVPGALERFKFHWDSIPEDHRACFSGVTALARDQDGNLIGTKFPRDVFDSNTLETSYRYHVRGDKWGFQRTDILRQFPLPVVEGTHFVPESIIWTSIAEHYRMRYVNEVLLLVTIQSGPHSDQLTHADPSRYAPGMAAWHLFVLNNHLRWFRFAPMKLLTSAVHYTRFSLLSGRGVALQGRQLTRVQSRMLWAAAFPVGVAVYVRDVFKAKIGR